MFSYAQSRIQAGFNLVVEASSRRDEHFGEIDWECNLGDREFSPERLEAAERRKAKAKADELAKAKSIKYCK